MGQAIRSVTIRGEELSGTLKQGRRFTATGPSDSDYFLQTLGEADVPITFEEESGQGWLAVLVNVVPFLLLIGLMLFMMRQMPGPGGEAAGAHGARGARVHPQPRHRPR